MKRTILFSFALVALIAAGGCNTLQQLDIRNPQYSIRDVRPDVAIALPLSASTIDLDFLIEVDNPNRVGLRLDRIDFDLLVNNSHVLSSISDQGVRIPANGVGEVRLRTRLGYNNLQTMFREVATLIDGNRATYEIRGRAFYDTPAGQLDFPLTIYRGVTGRGF